MKAWQEEQTVEAINLFGEMQVVTPRRVPACGHLAPANLTRCDFGLFCDQVKGHKGAHRGAPSACNRPEGHDGDHLLLLEDFTVVARW